MRSVYLPALIAGLALAFGVSGAPDVPDVPETEIPGFEIPGMELLDGLLSMLQSRQPQLME